MAELDPRLAAALQRILVPAESVVKLRGRDAIAIHDRIAVPAGGDALVESLPPVTVLRTSDLVNVTFRFVNLAVVVDGAQVLVRQRSDAPAFLIAGFGPQHLLEEAFFDACGDTAGFVEKDKDPQPDPPGGSETPTYPVQAVLSRSSRLAFRVAAEQIPWSAAGLLAAIGQLPLNVVPHAESAGIRLGWLTIADELGAVPGASRFLSRLTMAARHRVRVEPEELTGLSARQIAARRRAARERAATADAALAELADRARLQRTASQLAARFGAHTAVAAIAQGVDSERIFPPIRIVGRKPPLPRQPRADETALELPWRLNLSPHGDGAFAHSATEVEHAGRIELWHTRLGTRDDDMTVDEDDPARRTVRAVWTRDFELPGRGVELGRDGFPTDAQENFSDKTTLSPFRASLMQRDRMQLVHLTSNHQWRGAPRSWSPKPVTVNNLMLTALGGWLDAEVHFDDGLPEGLSIEEWRHRATMGRDHFVRVVYQGVLLPFGHRASLVKITERRIAPGDTHATLYQRLFVVVREPQRTFLTAGRPALDNRMPLRWVRIVTPSTPPLAMPDKLFTGASGQIFIPEVATVDTATTGAAPAGQEPFRFRMLANDVDNHLVEFEGPLIFVEKTVFDGAKTPGSVADLARQAANAKSPTYPMRGQRIAYAKPATADDTTCATQAITFDAEFDPSTAEANRIVKNYVLPVMRVTAAAVPAMSAFTGQSDARLLRYTDNYRDFAFGPGNTGELFLQLANANGSAATSAVTMGFQSQSDRSGGFVSPSVDVKALARRVGPVGGDLKTLAASPQAFDVGGMFGLDAAKLFGILPLAELLPAAGGPLPAFVTQSVSVVVALQQAVGEARTFVTTHAVALAGLPAAVQLDAHAAAFVDAIVLLAQPPHTGPDVAVILGDLAGSAQSLRQQLDAAPSVSLPRPVIERAQGLLDRLAAVGPATGAVAGFVEQFYGGGAVPEVVNARLDWETPLEAWPPAGGEIFQPLGDKHLRLSAEVQAPLGGGEPSALISCSLPPFDLRLMGGSPFITIHVVVMEFSVRPGRKPDVNVRLADAKGIEFGGPLAFVETLQEIIPFDGFSDPPYLDISTSGIRSGFDLAIPDLPMGIFALTNIHLGAELIVPFIGESLEFRFFFATRENPFRLQVAFFAGGGFFAITISPKGLKVIEASFEFGAAVEMSFVVASGSLSVMAGIYFRLELTGATQDVQLTGYFRARGEVDVLGLISASIELYLSLTYRSIGGAAKAIGKASISIEVSVCFVSFSVSVSCEKQFAGSAGDPTFVDMMGSYTDAALQAHDPWLEYCQAFATEPV